MTKSRAFSGMLSSKNDDFKFLKTEKHKNHMHHSSRAHVTVLSPQISLSLSRNMTIRVAIELY